MRVAVIWCDLVGIRSEGVGWEVAENFSEGESDRIWMVFLGSARE